MVLLSSREDKSFSLGILCLGKFYHSKGHISICVLHFIRLTKMMSDLDTLANFVKDNFPQDAHMPDLQVSVAPSSVACPEGKVIMVLPGNGTELKRTKCGKFPKELMRTSRF